MREVAKHAGKGILVVEMQAASMFAFAHARQADVGVVFHMTNAIDHIGEPIR
jgi:hypothetical protein